MTILRLDRVSLHDFLIRFSARGGDVSKVGYFMDGEEDFRRITKFYPHDGSIEASSPKGAKRHVVWSFVRSPRRIGLHPLRSFRTQLLPVRLQMSRRI